MLLAIDVGNTQTSFGIFSSDSPRHLLHHWRIETKSSRTEDEYAALVLPLLEASALKRTHWQGIALSSVVPLADWGIERFCVRYLDQEVWKIHHGLDLGVQLDVESPSEVGADRLVNASYAVHRLTLPAVVIDFGTATTFDYISRDGKYQGGVILPGVRMGVESLSGKTARLPVVPLKFPKSVVGRNTETCIQSGMLLGYAIQIDGLMDRIVVEKGPVSEVVLTGGLATLFLGELRTPSRHLPNLTLDGIALLFDRLQSRK
jgi:type III pantothenate kinase